MLKFFKWLKICVMVCELCLDLKPVYDNIVPTSKVTLPWDKRIKFISYLTPQWTINTYFITILFLPTKTSVFLRHQKKNILENFSIVFLFVPHYDWKRTHIGIPFLMDIIKTWYCYVFKAELENGEDVARCPSCSLILKVIYDLVSCFYGEAA